MPREPRPDLGLRYPRLAPLEPGRRAGHLEPFPLGIRTRVPAKTLTAESPSAGLPSYGQLVPPVRRQSLRDQAALLRLPEQPDRSEPLAEFSDSTVDMLTRR